MLPSPLRLPSPLPFYPYPPHPLVGHQERVRGSHGTSLHAARVDVRPLPVFDPQITAVEA